MKTYRTRIYRLASLIFCLAGLSLETQAAALRNTEARIASCDVATSRAAVDEMLRDPQALREPLMLFHAALAERMGGRKEEAAFLFLAARLRTSRQILFEQGDRPQLLGIMMMTVGPLVMPVLEADPDLARRVVRRTMDWDRSTPDPYRDRAEARSGENPTKIAEIDAGLGRLAGQLEANTARVAEAREQSGQVERQVSAMRAERCGPGRLDSVQADDAAKRNKVQESPPQEAICGFPGLKLPADFSVLAAGAYSGRKISRQIDQSGHQGTQIDVAVNNPDKAVVLILGAYEPTIWNISRSKGSKILAVLVGGYHRQLVADMDKSIPLLVSSYDNKGPCGSFYVTSNKLATLNQLSRRVFGRNVDTVYPAAEGKAHVGLPMPAAVTDGLIPRRQAW